jgi:hypothetical protein
MLKKINFLFILLFEFILLFIFFILLPSFFLKEKEGIGEKKYSDTLPLNINNSYLQPLSQSKNGLNSISVLLKNPGLFSKDSVKIELLNENMTVLYTLDTSGSSIEDPGWIKFKFAPINLSNENKLYIKVSSAAVKDNLLYIYGNKQTKEINFKTTYKSLTLKDSFRDNLTFQKNQFYNRSLLGNIIFCSLIIFLNLLVFISL